MIRKLLKWLTEPTYQHSLDAFVASKNPSTTTEVEYWINYYDKHVAKEWAL